VRSAARETKILPKQNLHPPQGGRARKRKAGYYASFSFWQFK
jgi:hypothetical protein